jgi:hypothetical protein
MQLHQGRHWTPLALHALSATTVWLLDEPAGPADIVEDARRKAGRCPRAIISERFMRPVAPIALVPVSASCARAEFRSAVDVWCCGARAIGAMGGRAVFRMPKDVGRRAVCAIGAMGGRAEFWMPINVGRRRVCAVGPWVVVPYSGCPKTLGVVVYCAVAQPTKLARAMATPTTPASSAVLKAIISGQFLCGPARNPAGSIAFDLIRYL